MGTNLFATHGLKHFLQLDSKLLDVVEDDAGLEEENSYNAVSTSICYVHVPCTIYSLWKTRGGILHETETHIFL